MNNAQETTLANLNDQHGVSHWRMEGTELHVWTDDGDEAEVHRDGTVTWKSVSA